MEPIESTPMIAGEERPRVRMTPAALDLVMALIAEHGPVMFHQSGGCCDGSAPMCYPAGEFRTGEADICLGRFELQGATGSLPAVEFWMSREQFRHWQHTELLLDAVPGRGSGFSLESPSGQRFLIRSSVISNASSFRPDTPIN